MRPVLDDADFGQFISEFTNYERLKEFPYGPDTLKLERMASFARDLGNPHLTYPAVHIAGTKGKGTTCLILEALLSAGGRKVGTYLSPHLEHLRERIRIGGGSISEADLCDTLNGMLDVLRARKRLGEPYFPTFFELMTALAMARFRKERVKFGIFEVGLGGRLDATNILAPSWTAITSIGLEHTGLLGATLDKIAREKAGIIKPGVPLVAGPLPPDARAVALEVARSRQSPVIEVPPHKVRPRGTGQLEIQGMTGLFPAGPVRGPGLRNDLAVAITLWERILESEGRTPRPEDLRRTLQTLSLPGRVEIFEGPPPVVIDGAHTPESIASLRQALEEVLFPRPRKLVFSLASDKRIDGILAELGGIGEEFILTRSDPIRSMDPAVVARYFRKRPKKGIWDLKVVTDPFAAFQAASESGDPIVVTGSFYLAGALRPLARKRVQGSGFRVQCSAKKGTSAEK